MHHHHQQHRMRMRRRQLMVQCSREHPATSSSSRATGRQTLHRYTAVVTAKHLEQTSGTIGEAMLTPVGHEHGNRKEVPHQGRAALMGHH